MILVKVNKHTKEIINEYELYDDENIYYIDNVLYTGTEEEYNKYLNDLKNDEYFPELAFKEAPFLLEKDEAIIIK